jgi:hypothetical protein
LDTLDHVIRGIENHVTFKRDDIVPPTLGLHVLFTDELLDYIEIAIQCTGQLRLRRPSCETAPRFLQC